jgi:chromosomal replication initiator protein
VIPRQIAIYLCRELTKASFPEIGDKFGGKDHSTIIHSVKKITRLLDSDLELKNTIETIKRGLLE